MRISALVFLFICLVRHAHAEVPRVATDIAPLHGLVSRVMAGVGTPDLILPPGASPHAYAMRPSEARALSQADLVIWVGPALTPWLTASLDALAADAQKIEWMQHAQVLPFRSGALFDVHDHHDHDHGHADHDDHDADAKEGAQGDPHVWLDPQNAIQMMDLIAETLAGLDPEHAAAYRSNAQAGQTEIVAVSTEIATALSPLKGRPFVVFHDAYHYFEARFGVEAIASINQADDSAASAGRLAQVRDAAEDAAAICILTEPQAPDGLVATVAGNTAVQIGTIDPMGSEIDLGSGFYPAFLMQLAQSFIGCLSDP